MELSPSLCSRASSNPEAVIGLGFSKMSALVTELCSKHELRHLVDYEALATTYRASSEGYPRRAPRAEMTVVGRSRPWVTQLGTGR